MSIKIPTPPFAAYEVILAYFLINVNGNYIFYAYFQCKKKGPAVTVGACGANYFLLFVAGIPSCRGFAYVLRRNDTGYMNSCHSYSFLIRSCFCALKYKALRHIVIMAYFT